MKQRGQKVKVELFPVEVAALVRRLQGYPVRAEDQEQHDRWVKVGTEKLFVALDDWKEMRRNL